ncbi:MAG: hypothetical protein NZM06_01555 [Chloroherpetonaceae bacterium]|nr:hypothetical protein [Chloroherpetonaceae bacterium]MDW8436650.1 hypothetical protein [Chloroherpetonaceae bacterium]
MKPNRRASSDAEREKSVIESLDEAFAQSLDDASELLAAKIELAKLDAIELLSSFAASLAVALLWFVGASCLFVALALYLGELFGRGSLGFLATGGALLAGMAFLNWLQPDWLRQTFLKLLWREYQRRQSAKR